MQEKIYFKDNEGKKICGILSGDTSGTVMLLIHGFSSSKESSTYVNLEEEFNRKRISTFRIDLYGHGESEGKFENQTISSGAKDIISSIDFVRKKGYKSINLFGSSCGGLMVLVAALKEPNLSKIGLKAPISNYPKQWLKPSGGEKDLRPKFHRQ